MAKETTERSESEQSTPCDHKFVFLKASDTYETGYRRWAHEDTFYCEKSLLYKLIEVEHKDRKSYGAF
jgi:hypothetical protein